MLWNSQTALNCIECEINAIWTTKYFNFLHSFFLFFFIIQLEELSIFKDSNQFFILYVWKEYWKRDRKKTRVRDKTYMYIERVRQRQKHIEREKRGWETATKREKDRERERQRDT